MRSTAFGFIVVYSLVTAFATNAVAELEPLFRITQITEDCSIRRPDDDAFSPASEGKAHPYGTRIRTGMRSSLVIELSPGNTCRVLANAVLSLDEARKNKNRKIVRLTDGEVEVKLTESFHKDGNALNVETETAIVNPIGSHFRVASQRQQEMRISIVRVIKGVVRLYGENFAATELKKNNWISLLTPPDRSFLRLKNMQGKFDLRIKGEDRQEKQIPTEEGAVLKIWQSKVPETGQRVVSTVLTAPDGTMEESVTITMEPGEKSDFGLEEQQDGEKAPWEAKEEPGAPIAAEKPDADEGKGTGEEQQKGKGKEQQKGKGKGKGPQDAIPDIPMEDFDPDPDHDLNPDPDPDPDPGHDEEEITPTEVGLR